MKSLLGFLALGLPFVASAGETAISGLILCDVVQSRVVLATGNSSEGIAANAERLPPGMSLTFEYVLDGVAGLSVSLRETDGGAVFFEEPFPAHSFAGVSGITNTAEFRAPYSEVSLGRFGMNYKGSDQFFLKNGCGNENWYGHYVKTHVSGLFSQVVKLECRPFVDAVEAVLARLAVTQ